jgi:primosomal protein N' (replication factor Y) (superfamily II helicase)
MSPEAADILSGPVDVCIDRPVLSLDRPFTYRLAEELTAGVGSLVSVPFHGRLVKGWVLGPASEIPPRMLEVKNIQSEIRFFDPRMLELLRWVGTRYVAPLASVIKRAHPPRVVSEESEILPVPSSASEPAAGDRRRGEDDAMLAAYRGGDVLASSLRSGGGTFLLRPIPEAEHRTVVAAVAATLAAGRGALVLVPESRPIPATASALQHAFGDRVALFLGGDKRERYRRWLELRAGRSGCVVATRPGVFAPVANLGLIWISRESHPGHREDRAPYYHVRDVALERARIAGAVTVLAALLPSAEADVTETLTVAPLRRAWPVVEVVRPGPEGRAPRLVAALRRTHRAFLYAPVPGYGIAQVCRTCGLPAACAACRGLLRAEEGSVRCSVCGASGRCASCGGTSFGIRRGGAERVEEWAASVASVPVRRPRGAASFPAARALVSVGGPEVVKDIDPPALDTVGILDADLAARRPGIGAMERALATWMEAAAWARPVGRVIVQTVRPNDPAVQALVSGNPERFLRSEVPRRAAAGFAPGDPVFRVLGTAEVEEELARLGPKTLLATPAPSGETVCLLAIDPRDVVRFGNALRDLATRDVVSRVEAEPHL